MKFNPAFLAAALVLIVGCDHKEASPAAPAQAVPTVQQISLAALLPTGPVEVEQLELAYSKRADELNLKLQTAVATNRNWFLDFVKRTPAGATLPYHPNLGLTETEYAEYLKEADSGRLRPGRRSTVSFQRDGDTLTIATGSADAPITRIKLNTRTGMLQASLGEIGSPSWRTSDREDTPIGAYAGYSWHREDGNAATATVAIVSLDIWRVTKTGKVFWRFKDSALIRGVPQKQYQVMFQYDLK